MDQETISERKAILAETPYRVCRRCGAGIPWSAAEDERYFIDLRQMPDSGGWTMDEIYCPECW